MKRMNEPTTTTIEQIDELIAQAQATSAEAEEKLEELEQS